MLQPYSSASGPQVWESMRLIPGSLLPRPRPLPAVVVNSTSCWGISEILWRNTFSIASAIKTMSSPGCRGQHIPLTTCPNTPLRSIVNNGCRNVNQYLIVNVAVSKHGVEVLNTFLGIDVVTVLQAFLDCSHVHRVFDYLVIVLVRGGYKSQHKPSQSITFIITMTFLCYNKSKQLWDFPWRIFLMLK